MYEFATVAKKLEQAEYGANVTWNQMDMRMDHESCLEATKKARDNAGPYCFSLTGPKAPGTADALTFGKRC